MVTTARVWAVLLTGAAIGLAALPLFGVLGYESSFVLGLLAALASAQLAGVAPASRRIIRGGSGRRDDGGRPLRTVLGLWLRAFATSLALLVAPLLVLLLNALRVKNCALAEGLGWYALLPLASAATGAAAGTVAGLATRTRLAGALLATAIPLVSIAWGIARFYAAPPVFGYDPFGGWFSGSFYDEALAIEPALVGARALHLLGALAALLSCAAFLDAPHTRLRLRPRPGLATVAAALCLLFVVVHRATRPRLAPTASDIAAELGGQHDTAHFRILFAHTRGIAQAIDWFGRDAEFRWSQLQRTFGRAPEERITIWLFESAEQKQRLLGASHVQIAKPWRHEVYVQWDALPHPVLAHELGHVFAGQFGDPIFRVARRGLSFNVGLIEGVAVAAGDPAGAPGSLSLDQQVKAMRQLGVEPRLEAVFGLAFLGEAPARAYTIAGSFVRFLLERAGPAPLADVYRHAGAADAWVRAYGRSFAELAADWSRRIDAAPLTDAERGASAERLRRPSILHRVCAHRLAARREEARRVGGRGDHEAAMAILESVCADDPDDPEPLLAAVDEAAAGGAIGEARTLAERVLRHPKVSEGQRVRALLFSADDDVRQGLADAATRKGRWARAAAAYGAALEGHVDPDTARQLRARRLAVLPAEHGAPFQLALARYLVGDRPTRDPAFDLLRAQQVIDADPAQGLGHYLLGRMLAGREHFSEAVPELDTALRLGLPDEGFAAAARRIAALAAFRAGDVSGARARFEAAARDPRDPGAAREAADWVARCAYF